MERYKIKLNHKDRKILYIFLYNILFIIIYISFAIPVYSKTVNLGNVGNTWTVVEKDVTEELKAGATKKLNGAIADVRKKIKVYQPPGGVYKLPACKKDNSFIVDMTWTLKRDIKDARGKIVYPKGYRFNPLKYVHFSKILVVVDTTNPDQMAWFKESPYFKDNRVFLLISNGYAFDVISELKRPVYYLSKEIAERLKLRSVPSVISRVGGDMKVYEFDVRGWLLKKKNEKVK